MKAKPHITALNLRKGFFLVQPPIADLNSWFSPCAPSGNMVVDKWVFLRSR
jgi:hypothetical protein